MMEKKDNRQTSDSDGDVIAASHEKPSDVHARNLEAGSEQMSLHCGNSGSRPSHRMKIPKNVLPNPGVSHDDEEYFMQNTKRGVALIINHYEFDIREYKNGELYRPSKREGTNVDREALKYTFINLGFEVECIDDKCHKEIKTKLAEVADQDHSGRDCLVVAVLSHGESGGRLHARDWEYDARDLWEPFIANSCLSLAAKPKLFFIQACRGHTRDPGAVVRNAISDSSDASPYVPPSFRVPSFADILIAYSTFEGLFAFRHPTKGSWYMQTLCSQLGKYAGTKDLVSLLTNVNRIVGQEYLTFNSDQPWMDDLVQGPCFISSLTRQLHLRPPVAPAGVATPTFE